MAEDINEQNSDTLEVPEIELIIKASTIDGRRKGACLFCQEYFMDLYLLAELKTISLKTVQSVQPLNRWYDLMLFLKCTDNSSEPSINPVITTG
ncbi:hypothetical protein AVEN_170547-1 [Araneus ventricosus]|uniref:CLIC N-terminal domain-containing protein n=1 Tax=Araneus ventricosus TaxID=182803 RepID=A0A4Y2BZ68_ARAVE|nr:hypothetical protein AVEN_170547-1 [Araneus ventricosus]